MTLIRVYPDGVPVVGSFSLLALVARSESHGSIGVARIGSRSSMEPDGFLFRSAA
jgi:hypothetical protein